MANREPGFYWVKVMSLNGQETSPLPGTWDGDSWWTAEFDEWLGEMPTDPPKYGDMVTAWPYVTWVGPKLEPPP
jgi:hypothetical protein